MKLYNNDSISGIVTSIQAVMPPLFNQKDGSVLTNFLTGLAEGFGIVIDGLNDAYKQSRINSATSGNLDDLIYSYTKERRNDNENDEQFRERYLRYVFKYNCTQQSMEEIIYDVSGDYPKRLIELNGRSAYWGSQNLPLASRFEGTAYYYDNIGLHTAYWGSVRESRAFVGYIFLNIKPSPDKINEICKIIRKVMAVGTKIYLVFEEEKEILEVPVFISPYNVSHHRFDIGWQYIANKTGYQYSVLDEEKQLYLLKDINTNNETVSITGLTDDKEYSITARTVKDATKSKYNDKVTIHTTSVKPLNLHTDVNTYNSLRAVWDAVPYITDYEFYLTKNKVAVTGYPKTVSTTYVQITGLAENTEYKLNVRSLYDGTKKSKLSDTFTTSTAILYPNSPTILAESFITNSSFRINFNLVEGATSYILSLKDASGNVVMAFDGLETTENHFDIYSLPELSSYTYKVKTIKNGLESAFSTEHTVSTLDFVINPPIALPVTVIHQTDFTAKWTLPIGVTKVRLLVSTNNFVSTIVDTELDDLTEYSVTGLTDLTPYKFKLKSIVASEESVYSNIINVTTKLVIVDDFAFPEGKTPSIWYNNNSIGS